MLPHLIGRRGPGQYVPASPGGGGTGVSDGGFVEPPVVTTTAAGNTTINGKVKTGSFGKFVLPLATITAGRQYTFRYTPQFSQLAQQGKLAMVGFGLKNGNDFHIVGLRGNGTTGLNKYKVNGTPPNGWNKDTGHTTSDGGAAANGTQAGPNYIRLVVSADGATYTFQTSSNGTAWSDEYTGQTPTPFSNVSGVATFGIALWFNNADAGPFSIAIDQFVDAVVPSPPFTFTDSGSWNGSATAITLASKSLGAADATRHVAVSITWVDTTFGGGRILNSVTIGGVAATLRVRASAGGQFENTETWSADVPTGATGDVVLTFNFAVTRLSVAIYRMTGLSSSTPAATGTGTTSASLSANAGDFIVVGSVRTDAQAQTLTNVTTDYDVTAGSVHHGVHGSATAGSTGTFTSTMQTFTSNSPLMTIAAWRQ